MPIFLYFCFNLCFGSVNPMTDVKTEDNSWILCHFHPTTAVATTPLRPLYTSNLNLSPHSVHAIAGPSICTVAGYIFSSHSTVLYTIITQIWYPFIITFSRGWNFLYNFPKIVFYITNYLFFAAFKICHQRPGPFSHGVCLNPALWTRV